MYQAVLGMQLATLEVTEPNIRSTPVKVYADPSLEPPTTEVALH